MILLSVKVVQNLQKYGALVLVLYVFVDIVPQKGQGIFWTLYGNRVVVRFRGFGCAGLSLLSTSRVVWPGAGQLRDDRGSFWRTNAAHCLYECNKFLEIIWKFFWHTIFAFKRFHFNYYFFLLATRSH